jgi:hypothetical protein
MGPHQTISGSLVKSLPKIETLICCIKKFLIFAGDCAGVAQLVEHNLAKVRVAGSSPVSRSNKAA